MLDVVYQWIVVQITTNDIFAGVIGGTAALSALYYLRSVPLHLYSWYLRTFTVNVTVHSSSVAFIWIQEWLATTDYFVRARRLRVHNAGARDDDEGVGWLLTLGIGWHWFFYRGRLIWVDLSIDEKQPSMTFSGQLNETINLRAFSRSRTVINRLLDEAAQIRSADEGVRIFVWRSWWSCIARRRDRPLESIILPPYQREALIKDMRQFLASEQWYADRGVPYRRGYLFHGEPGTGKTSLVHAIASHFNMSVSALNIGSINGDSSLQDAFWSASKKSILLIEDIDAAQKKRPSNAKRKTKNRNPVPENAATPDAPEAEEERVTLSCLLNLIDGMMAPEGQILVMTTNDIDLIDPALLRPGRADYTMEFKPLDNALIREQVRRFYTPPEDRLLPLSAVYPLRAEGIPAALVQSILLAHRDDIEGAVEALNRESDARKVP